MSEVVIQQEPTKQEPKPVAAKRKRGRPPKAKPFAVPMPKEVVQRDAIVELVQKKFMEELGFEPNATQAKAFVYKYLSETL